MRNSIPFFIIAVIVLALPLACDNEIDNIVNTDPPPTPGVFETVAIQVTLPAGVSMDFTTTTVASLFEDHHVSVSGLSSASLNQGGRSIASLQDTTGQYLLMSFITDTKNELSVASTVEVAVYFGLGTIFLPEEIKERFLTEVHTWAGFDELVAETESLFTSDRYFLTSSAFHTLIYDYIASITEDGDIIDIGLPRIVVPGDMRSGIQLEEAPGDAVILVNTYRRRAHAFFYKVSSKNLNGVSTVHVADIVGSNANFLHEVIVGPTSGFSGFLGTLQGAAEGKGLEFAKKDSDPTILTLLTNESEAKYKVRAIGPSPKNVPLTTQEHDKLEDLYIETLAFDFALPILLSAVGGDEFLKDFKASKWEPFLTAFEETVNALQSVKDPLFAGDFKKATTEFILALSNSTNASIFQSLYEAVIDNISGLAGGFSQENSQLILARSEKFFKILDIVDLVLQSNDVFRIYDDIFSSNTLEEWVVDLTRGKVMLNPEDTWVVQGEEKTFKTTIFDSNLAQGESYIYHYSIKENFGELRSKSSSAVGDSITSSSNQIGYFSSNTISLPNDALDTITIEVFINHGTSVPDTRVGEAKAAIEVRPLGFDIKPDSMTIDGGTQLKLYVNRTDGSNPIENSSFDYRFLWYTPGEYGLFNGTQSDIAVLNDNSIIYESLDRESEQGTENVEVSIYARKKGTTDQFHFVDRISDAIFIENDSLKESFFLDFVTIGIAPYVDDIYCNWGVKNAVYLDPFVPPAGLEVVDYTLTITEGWPAVIGTGATWTPSTIPTSIELRDSLQYHYGEGDSADSSIVNNVYVYGIGGTGAQGGALYCTEGTAHTDYADKIALYNTFTGKAQVVITLRYKQ